MSEASGRIDKNSLILGIISVVSPVIVPFFLNRFGGEVSIITAFLAVGLSYRDSHEIGDINVYQWLILGIISYAVALWNGFNVWVGDFQALISCLFFFGNTLFIVFTKDIAKKVKITAFVLIGIVIFHFIYTIIFIVNTIRELNNIKRSLGLL